MIERRGREDKILGFPLRDSNSLLHRGWVREKVFYEHLLDIYFQTCIYSGASTLK